MESGVSVVAGHHGHGVLVHVHGHGHDFSGMRDAMVGGDSPLYLLQRGKVESVCMCGRVCVCVGKFGMCENWCKILISRVLV